MSLNRRITDFRDMTFWLAGASTGIGHATADALLREGAFVAVSARKRAPLDKLAARYPGQVLVLPLDVANEGEWQQAHQQLLAWRPQLDQLLFCAADYQPMRAWTLDTARASQMIDVNIKGAMYGVNTVLPALLNRGGGGICLIASVAGYVGLPQSLVYGPTKAALINFCESLYLDLQPRGIAVSVVNPGFVATPLTAGNTFRMPSIITAEQAATEILDGLRAGEFEIHFPKRFTRWLKSLRQMPYSLQFKLLRKVAEQS